MNPSSGNAASVSDLSVLLRLAAALGQTERAADIYEAALRALDEGLGVRRSSILLFDADGVMRFKAWRGLSEPYRAAVEGHSPWVMGATDAAPIMVADPSRVPGLGALLPALAAEGIASLAFVPLISAGRVIGKFMLYFDTPRTLDPAELTLAQIIGAQVAFAVERTSAHRAVTESEERLRFALEAATMGTWEWDLRTGRVQWSESLERCHGLERGTFGGTFADFAREIHPDDRERVLAALKRALEGGPAYGVEYRVCCPDGTMQWLEAQGRVRRDAAGRPVQMSGICMNVTARKRAEDARLDAREHSHALARRLAAIVESSDDAIFSKDLDGRIASWNPAAERMFGYAAGEAIGRSIRLIVPPGRYEEEDEVLRRIRLGQAVEHAETVRRRKDGRFIDVEITVSPVRDASGTVTGASSIARDVTAKKQNERELADLHRRLTTLIAASTSLLDTPSTSSVHGATIGIARELLPADAYAIWRLGDEQWRMIVSDGVSPGFAARTFPPGTELPGATRHGRPLVVRDVQSEPAIRDLRRAYADEGIRAMLVCPMRFGSDRPGMLVFYYRAPHGFTDVEVRTAQALANLASSASTTAELHDEQRRQRDAAEQASRQAALLAEVGAVLARSLDYRATLNAVATLAVPAIADWCAVDMVGPNGEPERLAIAHADPSKVHLARELSERYAMGPERPGSAAHVIRTGQPVLIETITPAMLDRIAVDDEHRQLLRDMDLTSYICVPLVSPRRILGAITFVFAESGRHYRAQDVRFAEEVALRASLAIENANAYERVQEANRLKDDFLATLSHELRTPLNAILGYAQMLNMGLLHEHRQRQAFAVVRRNAESLKQIIDDILDVSRIIAGKLRLNVQPVELDAILTDAAATLQPAADAKGVQLETVLEPGVPPVSGDVDRLQQVVWNLLSNAVKFTSGGGRVELRLSRGEHDAIITVTDSGRGIHPAFVPHLFERFRQADSRFSREHGGLGLGLSIVRELVQLHGGTVSAFSEGPGLGAVFRVELPVLVPGRARAPVTEPPPPAVAAPREPRPDDGTLEGVRVLAVDDEEDALELLRDMLEAAGARVATAASGGLALDALASGEFDLLICDLGMPRMDGLGLIRAIRQTMPTPINRIPAIALTAYARSEDRITALVGGFQVHIPKPVDPAELLTAAASLTRDGQTPEHG